MAFQFPDPNVTTEFTADNGITYSWDAIDGKWVVKRYAADLDDRYVNKTGDTMTGPLAMEDASIGLQNGEIAFTRTGTDAELNKPPEKPHESPRFSTIKSTAPISLDTGTYDFSTPYGLQIPIDTGNTFKHKFKINNRNGDIVVVSGGTGPVVDFGNTFGGNQTGYEPGSEGGVVIKGIPTPAVDNPEPTLAVNKDYVDTRDNFLQQEIIELEEEIEALAPTTERGAWRLNLAGSVGQPGQFTMYDGAFGESDVKPNGKVKQVKSIWFNEIDSDNTPHGFAGVEEGDLLELFVDGSPEYGLWTVVGTPHYETAGSAQFWVIDVDFQRTLEDDTTFGPGELCRLKIFKAPEGGSASEFVRKTGDKMTGNLTMSEDPLSSGTDSPKVEFKSKNDSGTTFTNYLHLQKDSNILRSAGSFRSGGILSANGHIQYELSTRIGLGSDSATQYLGVGTASSGMALKWTQAKGVTEIRANNGWGSNGQVLKKYVSGSTSYVYWGTDNTGGSSPTYTITKENGNYYIK